MQRIVVLNPKGGSGKTTIAVNLASYFASRQQRPVLMDFDPQGSSLRWVKKRQPAQAPVHAIAAFERDPRMTRSFQLRPPDGTTHVIVDTPAALEPRCTPLASRATSEKWTRYRQSQRFPSCLSPSPDHHPSVRHGSCVQNIFLLV
jgi:chromosome partitioning protein